MAKKRGATTQTNAKKRIYKGIEFRSELEITMFKLLKRAKIPFEYEKIKFEIDKPFTSPNPSYEKFMKGTGAFKDRGNKLHKGAIYTPDFTPPRGSPLKWIVEVKGRSFPDFPRTWRLFKKLLLEEGLEDTVLFLPRTEKDCREVIKLIKNLT